MMKASATNRWITAAAGFAVALWFAGAPAQTPSPTRAEPTEAAALAARHAAVADELARSPFSLPLAVRSREEGAVVEGEIVGLVSHPFAAFGAAFAAPRAFCEVAVLHPNVKGCTPARVNGEDRITLHAGRKHYEPTAGAYVQEFAASAPQVSDRYLRIALRAPEGPLDTRDYVFTLEAMPAGDATFIAVRYAYRSSFASRAATAGYLATAGSGKTGFSRTETGEPTRGVRGVVERNAMRHYLALLAVLDTTAVPEAGRAAARLDRYYTLTDRFAAQLREFERTEYMAIKTREMAEQRARDAARGS